ncbi:MAG: histidine kinase [Bacteroidales bacterium]|nr:histidine kinase [Bacteroidales bacterium]
MVVLFLLISSFKPIQAQEYESITVDEGLTSNEIYYTLIDREGYLWFATDNGVSKYDGVQFINYTIKEGLADNVILSMFEDIKGRIWFISSSSQLSYFFNDKIHEYKFNDQISKTLWKRTHIFNNTFYVDENDNVSFGTRGQGEIYIDSIGNIFQNNLNAFLFINQISNSIFRYSTNLEHMKNFQHWMLMVETKNKKYSFKYEIENKSVGNIYILSLNDSSFLFSSGFELFKISENKSELISKNKIAWMDVDDDGFVWISPYNKGVFKYNQKDLNHPLQHFLEDYTVTSVKKLGSDALLFTTLNGAFIIKNTQVNSLLFSDEKSKKINEITDSNKKNGVWLLSGNDKLIEVQSGKVVDWYNVNNQLINSIAYSFKLNTLLFGGTMFGHLSDKSEETPKFFMPTTNQYSSVYINDILDVDSGIIYCGHQVGYVPYFSDTTTILHNIHEPLALLDYNAVSILNDTMFIASNSGVIALKNNLLNEVLPHDDRLKVKIIDIEKYQNGLLLATSGNGILYYKNGKLKSINEENGLSSNIISSICVTKNKIWAGSNNGLNSISFEGNKLEIKTYYRHNGLSSNIILSLFFKDDQLFVGTDCGLSYFYEDSIRVNYNTPYVNINAVAINEQPMDWESNIVLEYDQNQLFIEYISPNFINPKAVMYKYKLSGADREWVITSSRTIRYPNLQPAKYLFEVYAQNEDGVWSDKPATFSFEILQPVWQRWWFELIGIVLILGTTFFVFYRISQIKLIEAKKRSSLQDRLSELKQEALAQQMNPHFIFNTLSSIQYYININDKKASNIYLAMFAKLMRITLDNSFKKQVSIAEEIEALELYIQLEQLRFDKKFTYTIYIDSEIDQSRTVLPTLLIQPYVENAIWHGLMHKETNDGLLRVSITLKEDLINCAVEDNGVGRSKSTEINKLRRRNHKSMGAKITEARLRIINRLYGNDMQVVYHDLIDDKGQAAGTKVDIEIPLLLNN